MRRNIIIIAPILFIMLFISCAKEMESSYQPEDQLISNYSKHLINAETVNLSFPHDKSVMGYHDDPTIEFYPPGTYDPEKIEKVYIFGSVGLDTTITVNNNVQAT